MNRDSFWLLVIVVCAAGVALVSPVAAMVLCVGAVLLCVVLTRAYSYPGFLLAMALPLYLLVGGLNLSIYRGDIEPDFFRFMALSILALLGG